MKKVLGRALPIGLELIGTGSTIRLHDGLKTDLNELQKLVINKNIEKDSRENKHVEALTNWALGSLTKAVNIWEEILVDHPTDILALKFAHDTYFFLGKQPQLRDSIARVLPYWKSKSPPLSRFSPVLIF